MIEALARFVSALRGEGHSVSPSEVVDAARAFDLVGVERRAEVRAALRATLAKDRRAVEAFDRLFDRFFAPPPRAGRGRGEGRPGALGERPRPGSGERPGAKPPKGTPPPPPRSERPARRGAGERPGREGERAELERVLARVRFDGERRVGRLRHARLRRGVSEEADPSRRDLARRMTTEEERAIAREVPRMVRALRLHAGRRLVRARAGRPWLRRALRENLSRDGVPFVIPTRAPKRTTTRVVLLVDVSYSVARASGLFLLMASAFLDIGRRARVVAFVDRPVDATGAIRAWARGRARLTTARRAGRPGAGIDAAGIAFADVLEALPGLNLEAPSDYGRALHTLLNSPSRPRGRDTIVLILGDGRTNRFDPLPWALAEIARGCRAVLWLVPEPRSRWGTADSALPAYLPSADLVVEATDLAGLAQGLSALVRRI
ncbi:MAG TPA: VWA domain-containing protein [Candidatus Polarisedimenticolaceae bacterium]|nr:VWA domain-containing protein [Candidatus Polarisedimenticolaceae bacterium]